MTNPIGNDIYRTKAWQFTSTSLDDPKIADVRAQIKLLNAKNKLNGDATRFKIKLRGRLGKNNPNRHLYAMGNGKPTGQPGSRGLLHRWHMQSYRPVDCPKFDVYVHPEALDDIPSRRGSTYLKNNKNSG
jgi:hypothetical protein